MDDKLFEQLAELARSFNKRGIKPVICGGLGVYLCFYKQREDEVNIILRVTNDIDLMLTRECILEQRNRDIIAEIITGELEYIVRKDGKYFRFTKASGQELDILTPPVDGVRVSGFRSRLVRSRLHGYYTPEACFVEEDLRTISLSNILADCPTEDIEVQVPSPMNLLILKLFAFEDRDERDDSERAQAHAYDIYATVTLANRTDYIEGQKFLSQKNDSKIIQRTKFIVKNKFSIDKSGWQRVLQASAFYPDLNIQQKRGKLDQAKRRLTRWFSVTPQDEVSAEE